MLTDDVFLNDMTVLFRALSVTYKVTMSIESRLNSRIVVQHTGHVWDASTRRSHSTVTTSVASFAVRKNRIVPRYVI